MVGLPFMCCPTGFHSGFNAQELRVLLLCTVRTCQCGVQRAQTWACWGGESHRKAQQSESTVRLVDVSARTF